MGTLRSLLILLVLYVFVHEIQGEGYSHCKKFDSDSNYKLYWDLSTPGRVKFLVQAETAGWLGLGLSGLGEHPMINNGNMSDIWVGWVDLSSSSLCHHGCIYDYYTSVYQQPTLDPQPQQSLTLISANYSDGVTSIEFSRDLDTNDGTYDKILQVNELTTFIWALNPSSRAIPTYQNGSSFLKHNADTKGSISFKLGDPSQCTDVPASTSHSFTNGDGTYNVEWTIFDTDQTITFTITAATTGWVGIGFGTTDSMIDSDIYVGWIDATGKAKVTDRYATAHSMPLEDTAMGGVNNVINAQSAANGDSGITKVTFSRALNTGDKHDTVLRSGKIHLLWAYGGEGSVDYSKNTFAQHVAMGTVQVDLFEGTTSTSSSVNLFKVHGILMVVSVCLLLFPGILVSRFFKNIIPKWFYIHALLQTLGVSGIICAFAIIFVAKNQVFEVGLHQVCGLLAFSGFVVEFGLGLLSHFRFNPKRDAPPVFPDQTHWWLGRGVFLWALMTIFLGLRVYQSTTNAMILYCVWLGVALAGVTVLQHMVGQTHEKAKEYVKMSTLQDEEKLEESEDFTEKPKKGQHQGYKSKPMLVLYAILVLSVGLLLIGFVDTATPSAALTPSPASPVFEMSFNFDNFVVPNQATNYMCKGFYLLADVDYHITAFEPIKDNQEMLHHMILYETANYTGEEYFECSSMPKGSTPLFTWAVGGIKSVLPEHVGFRVGKTAGKFATLQIHYDNPNMWSGRTDSSGVKLTMTSKLRPVDAGYFVTGTSTKQISIPPAQPHYEIVGTCNTDSVFKSVTNPEPEYTIFSAGLHMHLTGRQIFTAHYRPDPVTGNFSNIGTIGCDDFFSFNDQKAQYFTNTTLRPGDKLITHCIYDTTSKTTTTPGCESTDCEMCLNFMIYYPKFSSKAVMCSSLPVSVANNESSLHCT